MQQAFDGDLRAGQVALDQQRRVGWLARRSHDRAHPFGCRSGLAGIVSPDDAAAARQRQRLDDAGKPCLARRGANIAARREHHEARLRHVRLGQRLAHRRLVARARDRERRVVRKAEALRGERRGHHALIVDADDRRERRVAARGRRSPRRPRRGSEERSVSVRSPIVADIAAARSDATVTATPNSRAAAMKSGAR